MTLNLFFFLVSTGLLAAILVRLNAISVKIDRIAEKLDAPKP